MIDCGVCISGYESDGECIGYRRVIVHARKEWACSECGCKIPKRSLYEYASWFYADAGGAGNAKTCLICAEIANAFMCGGRLHGECLWDSMEDVYHQLTTACFERLKTPAAKAELQRRWIEWKFSESNKRRELRRMEAIMRLNLLQRPPAVN